MAYLSGEKARELNEKLGIRDVTVTPVFNTTLSDLVGRPSSIKHKLVDRRPKLRRIRVEIERADGSVFTTVLTGTGVSRLDDSGWEVTVDAADMDCDRLIVLAPAAADKWLKRLAKRGIR